MSQREIARKAGVSVSAVSLALRNHPKISEAKRLEIQKIAREMGYRNDPVITQLMEHLRTVRPKREYSRLAILIPDLDEKNLKQSFVSRIIVGVQEQAAEVGFGLERFFLETLDTSPNRLRRILLTRGIKGIVVAPLTGGPGKLKFDFSGFCAATSGYSLVDPILHRSCPNYLQMLDEILESVLARGYRRIGLVMHYTEGGIGHKLFSSAYLFYQAHIPKSERIPILPKVHINQSKVSQWIAKYRPEAVIGPGYLLPILEKIGLKVPDDLGFASLDVFYPPEGVAGADHRYRQVGRETVKLVLSQMNLNMTGLPKLPKVVLVDSHFRPGFSLLDEFLPPDGSKRRKPPRFRGDQPLRAETGLTERTI